MRVNTDIGGDGDNGMVDVNGRNTNGGNRFRISPGTLLLFLGNLVFVVAWAVSLNSAQQSDRRRIEDVEKKYEAIDAIRGQLPLIQQRLNTTDQAQVEQNRQIERNQSTIYELQREVQQHKFLIEQMNRGR